jgi:hypothetical protein
VSVRVGSVTLDALFHRRLHELIGDGQWHDVEPVIRDLTKLVPPGVAIRYNERNRRKAGGAGPEQRVRPIAPEDAIRAGARGLINATIGVTNGSYELRWDNYTRQVRQVREPRQVATDRRNAERLRPAFNGLAEHFKQLDMDYASEQIQLTAHEFGFHLSSCPPDCSLVRLTKTAEAALDAEGTD